MSGKPNILFIMCDQLRWDYLSCAGHPHLHTPNIDRLAAGGVRFDRAFVQSPMCGPSRMSFYTGRYVGSHGATYNKFPIKVGEPNLGDHLRALGMRTVLVGKTHMKADAEGMARLGIDPESEIGVRVAECGFEPWERDDGLHPDGPYDPDPAYDAYLRAQGYNDPNPWQNIANSAEGDDGEILSGWLLKNSNLPARIREEDSETPYMTRRAIDFMEAAGGHPWCVHLSYIKPHWPYIVPAPYHAMYGPEHFLPVNRSDRELEDQHPLLAAYRKHRVSRAFSRDEVRDVVLAGYMGLIKQIDDQMGVLMDYLERSGQAGNTVVVFTSDHGDYLGDHWLGEKEMMHEESVRIPLIIRDPRPEADASRGTVSAALVEAIDLAPTFVEMAGGAPLGHVLEGRSLGPLLRGESGDTSFRDYAISEYDYSMREARTMLGLSHRDSRIWMIREQRWKYVYCEGMRPMLWDLDADPGEHIDLGADPAYHGVRDRMQAALFAWLRRPSQRTTVPDAAFDPPATHGDELAAGILIGYWDEADVIEERERHAKMAADRVRQQEETDP